ncbi:helix-turn-helix domain-containing protein [Neisseria polysaccharea]|uniref:helix-turn-helix domain-containing protein n=1 Tax=Neisseria polysaccharea TaxID=489 RepID=UPI0001D9D7F4|nr:helix-turn-helix domain-containing protein [Neisseria polysaccharea]EFH22540.1 hypothetical protein NEIPOLOT_01680 [Neisseria polysaccharea ATCC 43768]
MKHDCTNDKPKTPNQRQRILARLKKGSVTSWELTQMGILGYNTRILELRQEGHNIVTVMEEVTNQFGETVKRGRFSLLVSEGRQSQHGNAV